MMEKEKFIQISKKVLFWTAYTLLMGLNLVMLTQLIPDIYFSLTDVAHWRKYYTPIGDYDSNYSPNIYMHIWGFFLLFGTIISSILGSYFILKKKRIKGFLVLGFIIYISILMFFIGDYILELLWADFN